MVGCQALSLGATVCLYTVSCSQRVLTCECYDRSRFPQEDTGFQKGEAASF